MTNAISGAAHRSWNDAQDEILRKLMRANVSPRDIADRLSRTPDQIVDRAAELGVTAKRHT